MTLHKKCRGALYATGNVKTEVRRFQVPDDKVLFSQQFREYAPIEYTGTVIRIKLTSMKNYGFSTLTTN